jgi:hypothetical protein
MRVWAKRPTRGAEPPANPQWCDPLDAVGEGRRRQGRRPGEPGPLRDVAAHRKGPAPPSEGSVATTRSELGERGRRGAACVGLVFGPGPRRRAALRVNACPHGRDYVNRCCRHGSRSSRSAHPVATRRRPAAWPRDKGPAMPGSGYRPYRLRRYPVWLLWWSSSDPELRIALSALERPNCTWRSPCPRKCPNGVVFLYPALSEDDTPTYRSQGCAAL